MYTLQGAVNPFNPVGDSMRVRAFGSYDMIDPKPGAEFSDLHRQRIIASLRDPDPARKRETLKDEVCVCACVIRLRSYVLWSCCGCILTEEESVWDEVPVCSYATAA